jgi:hypothetical protein
MKTTWEATILHKMSSFPQKIMRQMIIEKNQYTTKRQSDQHNRLRYGKGIETLWWRILNNYYQNVKVSSENVDNM